MNKFQPTKISIIKKIWEEEGFTLKKSLSQNFLIDQNVVEKILNAAQISEKDTVLEIGPGSGALTVSMLDRGATVYAIEIDPLASKILVKYLHENPRFHLINQDVLKEDFSFLPMGTKIVSNLPYHITSPIIAKIADHHFLFTEVILMVQKEMGERIMAKAPSKNRSSFSIFTSYYFEKKSLFVVKPTCFVPPPTIVSVIISLRPKKNLPLKDPESFFSFVRKAFSQKRKMCSSVLKDLEIKEYLKSLGLNEKARPEELTTLDFLRLYNLAAPFWNEEKEDKDRS